MSYKIQLDPTTKQENGVLRKEDGAIIPLDPANSDYQKYLKWLDEGNTPEPGELLLKEI